MLGILDFRKNKLVDYRNTYGDLAFYQKPDALMIACCDSRVVPNVFASTNPGDLFVVRNIGNIVPPANAADESSVIAAIDFSVQVLGVKDIIVCGHSECGAMQALLSRQKPSNAIEHWLQYAEPSLHALHCQESHHHRDHNLLSQLNIIEQIEHLKTYPAIAERLNKQQLKLHGWWFNLSTADLYELDQENQFQLMDEEYINKVL